MNVWSEDRTPSEQILVNNFVDLCSKVENSSIDRIETSFLEGLTNHPNKASNEGWRHLVIN